MRPSWDDLWMSVAADVAERSLCVRARVGAVIVDENHRIVATTYNGPPKNFNHRDAPCTDWCERAQGVVLDQSYANCPSLHAEANGLLSADKSSWQRGTIYVTGDVCGDCTKLIANSGLTRVVVRREEGREYRQSDVHYRFLRSLGIGVEIWGPDD